MCTAKYERPLCFNFFAGKLPCLNKPSVNSKIFCQNTPLTKHAILKKLINSLTVSLFLMKPTFIICLATYVLTIIFDNLIKRRV